MIHVKQGDIFEVKIKDKKHFFRFIVRDLKCLSSDVIQCFDYSMDIGENINLAIIPTLNTLFYIHTVVSAGIKLKLWERVGNVPLQQDFEMPFFIKTFDTGIEKSFQWYVGQPNQEKRFIGELPESYGTYTYDAMYHPINVVKYIEMGFIASKRPS